jgi:hypothetical protein
MDPFIQWGITIGFSILSFIIGRHWKLLDRRIEHDKKVLIKILEVMPSNGSILFIREHDFGDSFNVDDLKDLFRFDRLSTRPEIHFLDKKIENLRLSLVSDISKFTSFLGFNSWQTRDGTNKIKEPDEYDDLNEYKKIRDNINELSCMVCDNYDSLIISASKKGVYTE